MASPDINPSRAEGRSLSAHELACRALPALPALAGSPGPARQLPMLVAVPALTES